MGGGKSGSGGAAMGSGNPQSAGQLSIQYNYTPRSFTSVLPSNGNDVSSLCDSKDKLVTPSLSLVNQTPSH